MRTAARALGVVLAAAVMYVAVTFGQVWITATKDERQTADAIVVLGAAQYDGQPSPALRARLDHAVELYADGLAPVVWATGGRQPGDRFSEASTSSRYLIRNGVPDTAVELEVYGGSSYESLAAAARYLRDRGQREVLLISDPWHGYRIAAIARSLGLRPHLSPASDATLSVAAAQRLMRETAAVAIGRLVGYRRLTALSEQAAPPPSGAPLPTGR